MRIFVTGGTGFIGARLCRRLASEGRTVYVLSRTASPSADVQRGGTTVTYVPGDLTDDVALRAAVRAARPEVVFHLASHRPDEAASAGAPSLLAVNGEATSRLLAACVSERVRPAVIYASAMGVYDYTKPLYVPIDEAHPATGADEYGLSKLVGESWSAHFAAKHALPVVVLRIAGVYGPGKRTGLVFACLNAAANGTPVAVRDGSVRRDFVYVDDVVEALVRAADPATAPGFRVYNIGAGDGRSLAEVVAIVERVTGRPVAVTRGDGGPGGGGFYLDITRAARDLGFRPRSLSEGVTAFWAEWEHAPAGYAVPR